MKSFHFPTSSVIIFVLFLIAVFSSVANARWYDPYVGRFVSRDPSAVEQRIVEGSENQCCSDPKGSLVGLNEYYKEHPSMIHEYNYAIDSPLNYFDIDGMEAIRANEGDDWKEIAEAVRTCKNAKRPPGTACTTQGEVICTCLHNHLPVRCKLRVCCGVTWFPVPPFWYHCTCQYKCLPAGWATLDYWPVPHPIPYNCGPPNDPGIPPWRS